jgi:hypothetical protein
MKTTRRPASAGTSETAGSRRRWWKWVCELCHRQSNRKTLPAGWDLCWQSAICPACQRKAIRDGIALPNCRGGQYAKGKPDPRANAAGQGAAKPYPEPAGSEVQHCLDCKHVARCSPDAPCNRCRWGSGKSDGPLQWAPNDKAQILSEAK